MTFEPSTPGPGASRPPTSASAALTIYSVADFAESWAAQLHESMTLEIDLGAVTACDTLGVQLLIAVQRSAASAEKIVRFTNIPVAVTKAAAAIGAEGLFSKPNVNP